MVYRRFSAAVAIAVTLSLGAGLGAAPRADKKGTVPIRTEDLKGWLTYLASDALEGRGNGAEGLGLAAMYIADQLKAMGVAPGGDNGTYFQQVKVLGVRSANNSTVTVEVNGQTRTFRDGDAITFPKNVGGKRTIVLDDVQFVGYGLNVPAAKHDDYAGKDLRGKAVVWLGPAGPKAVDPAQARRLLSGRNRYATETALAAAVIGPENPPRQINPQAAAALAGGQRAQAAGPQIATDFTTVQRLDKPVPPTMTVKADGGDAFWEFLFSASDVKYAALKDKAAKQEPLPSFRIKGAKLTFNLDAKYTVVQAQLTRNVVGIVPGADSKLKDSCLVYGAHYDHMGYSQADTPARGRGGEPAPAPAPGAPVDRIFNGADDDGSGSVALLAIAKAFQQGSRPKRSIRFVWFTGEERGLWGSRYDADFGPGPEKIVAELNMDMIGRNEANKPEESNTVYLIGSDRISTELHNINVDANSSLPKPLMLDYEFNDPADPNSFYTRSDHYSYAATGIPIIFYTTGEHPDYHRVTDSVEKIEWDKMTRIVTLAYETGRRVANLDHAPARDNKGPRAGKGSTGKIAQ
jgi:hypothetical protein